MNSRPHIFDGIGKLEASFEKAQGNYEAFKAIADELQHCKTTRARVLRSKIIRAIALRNERLHLTAQVMGGP